jgi:molecular chaperone DnaK
VNVSAKDKATNKEQQIRIQASGGLSDNDIESMVQEAEKHAASDKQKREVIESRNKAEGMIHEAEKNLEEHGAVIQSADKKVIESSISALKAAIESGHKDDIEDKTQALTTAMMKIGEDIYKAQQSSDGSDDHVQDVQSTPVHESADGEVLDADFEEVDEQRKKKG